MKAFIENLTLQGTPAEIYEFFELYETEITGITDLGLQQIVA